MDEPKVPVGNTNQYLRLIRRHWLVVPPGTNLKVTNRYLRFIHRFHPPQKYRYEPSIGIGVHTGTFGLDLWRVF